MRTLTTNVAVLGAGTAGLNARKEAEKAGKSWLLIDGGPYGTTCARVGCMPSKLLIAAAEAAHHARATDRFGVHVTEVTVDGPAVMQRVRAERDRFVGFVVEATESLPEERRLRGMARLVSCDEHGVLLEVTLGEAAGAAAGEVLQVRADAVVVATGSSPFIPPPYRDLGDRLWVNDDVFDQDDLPASVAVIGTGVIGLELGQALHRLGVSTHLFNLSHAMGPLSDPEVLSTARQVLGAELPLHLGVSVETVERVPDGVRMVWTEDGERQEVVVERVLVAAGRRSNVAALNLEALGLPLTKGMPHVCEDTMQAGELPVFFAGDVTGRRTLLHEASDEGRVAGANAASWPEVGAADRRVPLAVAFTDPQIALVGERYVDLDAETTAVGAVSYADQGRARVMGLNAGMVRIYADRRSCRLVGAEMFGPRMEHMAHLLAWAVADGLTVHEALRRPFYHPVLEEGLRTALRDLARDLRVSGRCMPEERADGPGE